MEYFLAQNSKYTVSGCSDCKYDLKNALFLSVFIIPSNVTKWKINCLYDNIYTAISTSLRLNDSLLFLDDVNQVHANLNFYIFSLQLI